jgi:hypothetical protein
MTDVLIADRSEFVATAASFAELGPKLLILSNHDAPVKLFSCARATGIS